MILLRKAHIYDVRSKHHNTVKDVLIEKGVITKISKKVSAPSKAKVISSSQLCISPGWLDIGTYNGEPGHEYREDLASLTAAAARGGYLGIVPFSTSDPVVDNKGQLHFLKSQSQNNIVEIHPVASLSKDGKGKDLAELLDLHAAGAVAFSDGDEVLADEDFLVRAMQYLKSCNGILIQPACKKTSGEVNEGEASVMMGLEGIPEHKEIRNVEASVRARDYSDGRLFIYNISCAKDLNEIKKSSDSSRISVSIPHLNLIFDESDVSTFDLNLKVSPPLRSSIDKKALIRAIVFGQVNTITSQHRPLSKEEKDQPFGMSAPGAATIETVFSSLVQYAPSIPVERLVHCLSVGPHEALGFNCPTLSTGSMAYITLFDPTVESTYDNLQTKGVNSPFQGETLAGKVLGIINGSKSTISSQ